jgi:DNA-binding YbaB/EbfC family protein
MLARAQKLQAKMSEVRDNLTQVEVTGASGSGLVKVVLSASGDIKSISIDKSVINPDDKDMLEDLVLAAFRDAKQKADETYEQEMTKATGGLNVPGLF